MCQDIWIFWSAKVTDNVQFTHQSTAEIKHLADGENEELYNALLGFFSYLLQFHENCEQQN